MANDFKVGDRVRLVHEGVVTRAPGIKSVHIDGVWRVLGEGETVEVLERKVEPYRPGTVVVNRLDPHNPAIRASDGWRGRAGDAAYWAGSRSHLTDEDVRRNTNFTVVYEPPA